MDVAKHVIEKCGGPEKVAEMLGCHVTRVYRWTYPAERGGTGGIIPSKRQGALLVAARARGIDLSPADFFPRAA
jgi:hypothetical protein